MPMVLLKCDKDIPERESVCYVALVFTDDELRKACHDVMRLRRITGKSARHGEARYKLLCYKTF